MAYQWRKQSLIFRASGQYGWMNSHAQVPTSSFNSKDGVLRVYFATRPKPGLSLTTYVDLDAHNLNRQLYLCDQPILPLGDTGMFDEHGIMPSSIVHHRGAIFLYYSGWSRGTSLPYANFTGLAISEDGGNSFQKIGPGPILDRTSWGPYSATSPCVLKVENDWYMFYCSGTDWIEIDGRLEHVYDVKIARSDDGIVWSQSSKAVIPQRTPEEAITRPTIYYDGSTYHMWFCFRGSRQFRGGHGSYRIGYASSRDLLTWSREDDCAGIACGSDDWCSQMLAYPDITSIDNSPVLLLNGNGFGYNGFGYAVCSYKSSSSDC